MYYRSTEKCLLSICFALFVANNSYKSFSYAKKCGFFSSVFKKIIPNITTPTFQEVDALSHRKFASTNKPVAFRSVHTGIEPPFLLKINFAITACMTRGFTSR